MLVGIDDDGVRLADCAIRAAGRLIQRVRDQAEVSAVCRIDMDSEAVPWTKRKDLIEGIDGANCGGAERYDYRADIAFAKFSIRGRRDSCVRDRPLVRR